MQKTLLDYIKKIHFVGIGGSGMCPLAEILHGEGYQITGSDAGESDNVRRLEKMGIPIAKEHRPENVAGAELVVYTSAVRANNPELTEAKRRGIQLMERGALLGLVSRRYARSVAIAGTHGKTTTTSMLSHILLRAGEDPTLFIGGRLPLIQANGRAGKSDLFVGEACEFQDHYLSMRPALGVILNVDADHLDYFGSLDGVIASFHKFARLCHTIIANGDDENTRRAVANLPNPPVLCGKDGEWRAENIVLENGYAKFNILHREKRFAPVALAIPGGHNVQNALMAAAAADWCGVPAEKIAFGLSDFHGAGRRFEFLGTFRGVTVADDYAHHPTEITATLKTARTLGYRRVLAVFQPFTFSRTARHLEEFSEALSLADIAVVCDIMGSREENTFGVHAKQITDRMTNGIYLPDFPDVCAYITREAREGDLVLTMGGGNIYFCARMIASALQ